MDRPPPWHDNGTPLQGEEGMKEGRKEGLTIAEIDSRPRAAGTPSGSAPAGRAHLLNGSVRS